MNITPIIEAVFAFIAAIITAVVVPYIKSRTTAAQQAEIAALVKIAVTAAEQIYKGTGRGAEKKAYVLNWLREHDITVCEDTLDALNALGFYNGKKNGYAWCDIFCDWCFVQAFGLELALKMTGQKLGGYGAGCTESVNYYKAMGRFYKYEPRPGDQIFFTQNNGQSFYHTGLVEKVENGKVFTIEGNTSSAAGVVENGGAVRDKSYSLGYIRIGGYGRTNYSLIQEDDTMTGKEIYDALQGYLSKQSVPGWAQTELAEAVRLGITDGKNPLQLIPKYQAAIMAKRAAERSM